MYNGDIKAIEAWQRLKLEKKSCLIDVRSSAEHVFVGIPALETLGKSVILLPWQEYPEMEVNSSFLEELNKKIGKDKEDTTLIFLCRSGVRSSYAAQLAHKQGYVAYNIKDGFEGKIDSNMKRGMIDGWKAAQLPWRQS